MGRGSDRQLPLDLTSPPRLGRGDLVIGAPNAAAVAALDRWHGWPGGKLLLCGPARSGKTHLARIWAAEAGAGLWSAVALPDHPPAGHVVVEDIDRIAGNPGAEVALFHLHNAVLAGGGRLLLTGTGLPGGWGFTLPDLASRIAATAVAGIEAPDDALLTAVLWKLCADRQILPQKTLIPWLVTRMPRSLAAAETLVDRLDRAALAEGREVSRGMAQRILDNMTEADA